MKHTCRIIALAVVMGTILAVPPALAIPIMPDTFEGGTTQGWLANLLGMGSHPAPPANVPDGGPTGAGDAYLQVTALGGFGSGSRLSVINLSQWAGDYIAAGITAITLSANNMGPDDLFLRLAFEDPTSGPPANIAYSSDPIFLPAGSGWTMLVFPVGPSSLTAGIGDVLTALQNTTLIRIYSSAADNFPNPGSPIDTVNTVLGVDNIAAVTTVTAIPEPATLFLLGAGISAVAAKRRFRKSSLTS